MGTNQKRLDWLATTILSYRSSSLSYITLKQRIFHVLMNCHYPYGTHSSCSSAYLVLDEETENEDLYCNNSVTKYDRCVGTNTSKKRNPYSQ